MSFFLLQKAQYVMYKTCINHKFLVKYVSVKQILQFHSDIVLANIAHHIYHSATVVKYLLKMAINYKDIYVINRKVNWST